jgi:uncharacterized protein (TIGR03086 family)
MTAQGDIWRQAAAKWNEVAAEIGDRWDAPTPCDGWTVRDLVDHAMGWQARGGALLGAGTGPADDWATVEPALSAALDDPANLEGTAESFGGMPKQQAVGFVIGDLLIHSWDLARALGADETLPADAVDSTLAGLARVPDAMLRGPNMFGPPIEVADDAGPQERLLGFVGRRV